MKKRYVRYRLIEAGTTERYVRYRLIAEANATEQNEDNQQKQDGTKTDAQGTSTKTALQLLGQAVVVLTKAGAEATRLVYTALKQMGGTIIALIKKFIQKLPSIASKVFSVVYSMVKIFWNTFGKGFLNLLKGFAAICATFFGSLSDALDNSTGGTNAHQGGPKPTDATDSTAGKTGGDSSATGASLGSSNTTPSGKKESIFKQYSNIIKNPLSAFGSYVNNPTGNENGKSQSNNYAPDFILSNRAIKILNEAANNPGMASKTLDNIIEKAKPKFKNLCYRCIKSNTAKTDSELACTIGASTILVCGYPSPSNQFTNLQNRTNAKTNL